jgi:hypothetical protein
MQPIMSMHKREVLLTYWTAVYIHFDMIKWINDQVTKFSVTNDSELNLVLLVLSIRDGDMA